jgi:diguanylate cyclase (GGDEF)-like protein
MTGSPEARGFAGAVLDALTSHICVLDSSGTITLVNEAWRRFALENSPAPAPARTGVGSHYLEICRTATGPGSEEAAAFAAGVRDVLEGRSELFRLEYPCHSPTENRWFVGRVTPLRGDQHGAVVSHQNVTDRKLVEFELAKLAATDPLTGLPNRRFFLDIANREVDRVRRFSVPASVAMIDIDHFKDINDTYGHAAGDEALRHLATSFKSALREVDVLARLGGEEFALLLPGTNENGAQSLAEKMRAVLSSTPVSAGKSTFRLTASFGATDLLSDDLDIAAALGRADAALYAAKRSGRDCVKTFSDLDGPTQSVTRSN